MAEGTRKHKTRKNSVNQTKKIETKRDRIASTIALAVTVFLCVLTMLEYSVACIWGGDEAIGLVHMVELVSAAVIDPESMTTIIENTGTKAELEAEIEANINADETVLSTEKSEDTEEIVAEVEETQEEREARELEERIAIAEYPFYIKVNREQCCITVYAIDDAGTYTIPYVAMTCSTGLYNRTPLGTFKISDKYVWRDLNGGVCGQYASRVVKGVLFHSVPYYSHSKNALCSSKYNQLGEKASAGCIRLTVADAKWIYENCPSGTTVEIYDDEVDPGPLGKPETIELDLESPNKGWDPTDPDEENPWRDTDLTENM